MCIPHASTPTFSAQKRERKQPKKHIEFDEKRMKGDPDFVDERTQPYEAKSSDGLFSKLKSLFSS